MQEVQAKDRVREATGWDEQSRAALNVCHRTGDLVLVVRGVRGCASRGGRAAAAGSSQVSSQPAVFSLQVGNDRRVRQLAATSAANLNDRCMLKPCLAHL